MEVNKRKVDLSEQILICVYLLVQLSLYIISIFFDVDISVKYLYYTFIIINFIMSIIFIFLHKNKDSIFLMSALFFTLISDTFLVLIGGYKEIAMMSFSVVQVFYFIRLLFLRKERKISIIDYIRLCVIFIIVFSAYIILNDKIDVLVIVVCFYYPMLILNFIESCKYFKTDYKFVIGLFLFILCDTIVGLTNCSDYFIIPDFLNKLMTGTIDLAWLFYFPSQILLTLSRKIH